MDPTTNNEDLRSNPRNDDESDAIVNVDPISDPIFAEADDTSSSPELEENVNISDDTAETANFLDFDHPPEEEDQHESGSYHAEEENYGIDDAEDEHLQDVDHHLVEEEGQDEYVEENFEDIDYHAEEEDHHENEEEDIDNYAKEDHDDFEDTDSLPIDSIGFQYAALSDEERNKMIDKLKELHDDFRVQMVKNKFLHKNYINFLRNSPSLANALDKFDEVLVFEDARYQVSLENYAQILSDLSSRKEFLTLNLQNLEKSYSLSEASYRELHEKLFSRELTTAKKIRPVKLPEKVWNDEVDRLIDSQKHRSLDVAKIRLSHVRLHYRLEKLQIRLKELDNLGPGFSMVDYESLRKKKRVYGEKYEEQREHAVKISRRNLTQAATIRHIDEEFELYSEKVRNELKDLSYLENENKIEHCKDVELAEKRTNLFKEITRLREHIGLLDKPFLLHKMELDLKEIAELKKRSEIIKSKIISDDKRISQFSNQNR